MNKLYIVAVAAAFFAFHLILFGGAAAYMLHLIGIDVPLLDHHHGCDCAAPTAGD